jgi:hypothetical protein
VPVVVDVLHSAPEDGEAELAAWDVVEASLAVPTRRVAIDGCTSHLPERSRHRGSGMAVSPHFGVAPGTYRVRVYYGGLGTHGGDHYRIALWPQEPFAPPRVLKFLPRPTE